MSEVPSRLYEHLSGAPDEIVARLESLGLLAPVSGSKKDELLALLRTRVASHEARGGVPPSTGQSVFSVIQTAVFPYLSEKGLKLAGERGF